MATKPGVYQQKKSQKWRYWDGKKWVGERYDTKQEAETNVPEPEPSEDDSTPTKRWPIILSIILVVLVALIVGGLVFINHQSAKEAQLEQQVQTPSQSEESIEAPNADSVEPDPEELGNGVSSEQKNSQGYSKTLDYEDADYKELEVYDDNVMEVAMDIGQTISDNQCQSLTQKYPTIQDISCPVSDNLNSTNPEIGYMGYDAELGAYRANGGFTEGDGGGFVVILNDDYQPVYVSYIQPVSGD